MDSISTSCRDEEGAINFALTLNTEVTGKNAIFLDSVSSTNDLAKQKIEEMEDGTIILSNEQTKGRGSRESKWYSPEGKGLWFTLFLKDPPLKQKELPLVNLTISLVILKSIRKHKRGISVKWPNDLLIKGKKVSGILCELKKTETFSALFCGIGINTGRNMGFPQELSSITASLEIEGEKDREHLLKEILEKFELYYKLLCKDGPKEIVKEWKKYCITFNADITDIKTGLPCKAIDTGNCGELIVQFASGDIKKIYSGKEIIQVIKTE